MLCTRHEKVLLSKILKTCSVQHLLEFFSDPFTHPAITCSKSTVETLEQGVKYIQN